MKKNLISYGVRYITPIGEKDLTYSVVEDIRVPAIEEASF